MRKEGGLKMMTVRELCNDGYLVVKMVHNTRRSASAGEAGCAAHCCHCPEAT
jgi:hypothetical protein